MLKFLCDKVLADKNLEPKNGQTFCNIAVNQIAMGFGYACFDKLMANQMVDYMAKHWKKITMEEASILAMAGKLVIAGQKGEKHGHVAVLYPLAAILSGHWQKKAPVVANVGKKNGIMGANFAFATEPDFWTPRE